MDARLRDGILLWTVQDRGECRNSLLDRTWFLARGRDIDINDMTMQSLARCSVAVGYLGCGYDEAVTRALQGRE